MVDLRVYTIRLRKMAEFIDVFDRLAMPVQLKYLGRPLGIFSSAVGPLNQVVHLWGFNDMGDFERRHAARDKDPIGRPICRPPNILSRHRRNRLIRKVDLPSLALDIPVE
jgi:hypothetical protein